MVTASSKKTANERVRENARREWSMKGYGRLADLQLRESRYVPTHRNLAPILPPREFIIAGTLHPSVV
jgi:hypothetical protein